MNTNGTGSRDTWGQERQGWAPLAEQWGDKEREVAEMPQRGGAGTPGPPEQHTWDAQTQRARDEGRPPQAAGRSSRCIRCAGSGHRGSIIRAEGAKGLRSPQHRLWP